MSVVLTCGPLRAGALSARKPAPGSFGAVAGFDTAARRGENTVFSLAWLCAGAGRDRQGLAAAASSSPPPGSVAMAEWAWKMTRLAQPPESLLCENSVCILFLLLPPPGSREAGRNGRRRKYTLAMGLTTAGVSASAAASFFVKVKFESFGLSVASSATGRHRAGRDRRLVRRLVRRSFSEGGQFLYRNRRRRSWRSRTRTRRRGGGGCRGRE